ncbi:MAG: thiol reductase thioredoxin [Clostridium sp.]|nr:thiol reductase thioredoxin [Clostridium sp.]
MDVNNNNFKQEVLESEIPVIVDFKAPWCGYCRRLEPMALKLGEELAGKVKIVMVDIDKDPEIAEQYKVMTIPNLMLFRGGEKISSVVNPTSRDAINKWLGDNGLM